MNKEIIIDFSNGESIILKTISSAVNYIVDMFVSEIHALGIHLQDAMCNLAGDTAV